MRAVVIGGSVAGLAASVGLARRGWQVDVIERDPAPETSTADESFLSWNRSGVPQFRQPHGFSARSRTLLLEHIPEVVDRLLANGIPERNFFKELAPPELWEDGDDAFTGLWSRRPGFELAIRRVAEAEPGVSLRCTTAVEAAAARMGRARLRNPVTRDFVPEIVKFPDPRCEVLRRSSTHPFQNGRCGNVRGSPLSARRATVTPSLISLAGKRDVTLRI